MVARNARGERLSDSRRQLTKLLVIASLIKYRLAINDIDVGHVNQDEINEGADLARHGSVHLPTILVNDNKINRFEHYVLAWTRLSIETGVLEVLIEFDSGEIVVGLPDGAEKRCVVIPSPIEKEFKEFR